jgi:arylsulfatase A-like enzyme
VPSRPPDIIIVVMDCVRADLFSFLSSNGSTRLPFAASLMPECLTFSRAVAPASWTLPSTASLLSGLYPWEHGVWGRNVRSFKPGSRGLAHHLGALGYRTAALCANPLLSPDFSPMLDFGLVVWGSLSAQYLRTRGLVRTPQTWERSTSSPAAKQHHGIARVYPEVAKFLQRNIGLVDGPVRILRRVLESGNPPDHSPSPWIEPALRRFFDSRGDEEPVFAFLNLMEAHEPYVGLPLGGASGRSWRTYARHRQDRAGWLSGAWIPDLEDCDFLEAVYAASMADIDRTLARIVRTARASGRWNNSIFVLTSDHGQVFEPNGLMYHGVGTPDSLLRVPLWIRFPESFKPGRFDGAWVSLVDVLPTILSAIGYDCNHSAGVPLQSTIRDGQREPVFALSDGLVWDSGQKLAPTRIHQLDKWAVVAYAGNSRFSCDLLTEGEFTEDVPTPAGVAAGGGPLPVDAGSTFDRLREIKHRMSPELATDVRRTGVDARLAGWGYV